MHMLFSTNIFIWTAVSCNCSEGTAAADRTVAWGWQKLLQAGQGLAEPTASTCGAGVELLLGAPRVPAPAPARWGPSHAWQALHS